MISSRDLNRCIQLLAEINAKTSNVSTKEMTLEIGYILKQELDVVAEIERRRPHEQTTMFNIDSLYRDNTQLFQNNQKLIEENMRLKELVEERTNDIERAISNLTNRVIDINNKLNEL